MDQERSSVLWGPSPRTPAGMERTAYAAIDGEAGTRIHPYKHIDDLSVLQYDVTNAVHWVSGVPQALPAPAAGSMEGWW